MKALAQSVTALLLVLLTTEASANVRSLAEKGSQAPSIRGTEVLLIQRRDVAIGCSDHDAAPAPDAAPGPDAGSVADAAPGPDAAPSPDGALPDAQPCTRIPGDAVTMVVQPRFAIGAVAARFAILLVTPSDPILEIERRELFADLANVTAPQVIVNEIRVEDPALGETCFAGGGCGQSSFPQTWIPPAVDGENTLPLETVGPYEIARYQRASGITMAAWLDELGYLYAPADLAAAAPYVERGYTVLAVRVIAEARLSGGLSPLAMTWAGTEFRLPLALARSDQPGTMALTAYIAADARYDIPGATVTFAQQTNPGWARSNFLTRSTLLVNLQRTLDQDPVATRAATNQLVWETHTVDEVRRVPVTNCDFLEFGCCRVDGSGGSWIVMMVVVSLVLAIPRRRRG